MRTFDLFKFIDERHSIYERRQQGLPKPWTKDKILQNYRFCNVYRELDTQTLWFSAMWRQPNRTHIDLWFASLVFRLINWHETLEDLNFPVPWDPEALDAIIKTRKERGEKVYGGAYMISTHGVEETKHTYIIKLLNNIWNDRDNIRYREGETLEEFHTRLTNCFGVGRFIAGQVIADCKYAGHMLSAPDWFTFATSGPGSKRGLNRILNQPTSVLWKEEDWRLTLATLRSRMYPFIAAAGMTPIHAQDLQNCLCEFDKYERIRLGEGRVRQRYNGGVDESNRNKKC